SMVLGVNPCGESRVVTSSGRQPAIRSGILEESPILKPRSPTSQVMCSSCAWSVWEARSSTSEVEPAFVGLSVSDSTTMATAASANKELTTNCSTSQGGG